MPRAVRTPNWLGDLCMSLPALSSIRSDFPDVSFWSHPRVSGLLPVFFPGNRVYTGSRLPRGSFDRLLLMTGSFRSALQGLLSGIGERTGFRGEGRRLLLTRSLEAPADRDHHHSQDYLELARAFGATVTVDPPQPLLQGKGPPHAAFFAGARYGSAKMWSRFPELASLISDRTGLPPVFYGTNEEEEFLGAILEKVRGARLMTGLDLPELAQHLGSSRLAVGNDSGGVHLSAALGIPTVAIFGSTSPAWTAPLGPLVETVASHRSCSPCFRRSCPLKDIPMCMEDIGTDMVLNAAMDLLEKAGGSDDG